MASSLHVNDAKPKPRQLNSQPALEVCMHCVLILKFLYPKFMWLPLQLRYQTYLPGSLSRHATAVRNYMATVNQTWL